MANVFVFARYSRMGASSRVRSFQYLPFLEQQGLSVRFEPLLDDAYLERLYSGGKSARGVPSYYIDRVRALRQVNPGDVLLVEKELFPWIAWSVERRLLPAHAQLVVDMDDAIFHRYDRHRSAIVRRALGHKVDGLLRASALVTAGNQYLADRALGAGAANVQIVPTVVNPELYEASPQSAPSPAAIGWIGTPQTWATYGEPLLRVLGPDIERLGAQFLAVGAALAPAEHGVLRLETWSEATEVSSLRKFSVGVMPLDDTPWARGKCGYKLIQYMACGLPVVASPVGVNRELVRHGENGFLASTESEWRDAIEILLNDADLRQRMGAAGRRLVESSFSLQCWGPRFAALIASVAEAGDVG